MPMKTIRLFILVLVSLISSSSFAQEIAPYKLYNSKGKEVSFSKMIKSLSKYDVILLGELHNDPVSHWMHFEIVKTLSEGREGVNVGFEMLEADDRELVNEYVKGVIREKDFLSQARLWPNHKTDYHPLIKYCLEQGYSMSATNVPRRYAALVARKGVEALDSLTQSAKAFLPPLPFTFDSEAPEYAQMMEMMSGHGEMSGENMAKAQALKDAAMAWFLLQDHVQDGLSFHINGDYHSADFGGIFRYLKLYDSGLNVATFSTVSSQNGTWKDEFEGRADYILVVTDTMTKTH